MILARSENESITVLGVRVDIVGIHDVVKIMDNWIEKPNGKCRQIVNTGMHGIMVAHKNHKFKNILNSCDLFFPDGISIIWNARLRGHRLTKKDTGPALMLEFSKVASEKGYSAYFYGDTNQTLELLIAKLTDEYPGLKVAGAYSPPFRSLTPEEDDEIIRNINQSAADVLWVGLGCPKQEQWIFDHKDKLQVKIAAGVGAYFKFHSGQVKRAPKIVADSGLEWLWRFALEPRRMWRRVLVDAPQFIGHSILELTNIRKYR